MKPKLKATAAAVARLGHSRVKPSEYFSVIAQMISNTGEQKAEPSRHAGDPTNQVPFGGGYSTFLSLS